MKLILEKKDKIKIALILTLIIGVEALISYNQTNNFKKVNSNLNEAYSDRILAQNYLLKLNELVYLQKDLCVIGAPNNSNLNKLNQNNNTILAYLNKFETTYLLNSEILIFEKTKELANKLFNDVNYNKENLFTNKAINLNFISNLNLISANLKSLSDIQVKRSSELITNANSLSLNTSTINELSYTLLLILPFCILVVLFPVKQINLSKNENYTLN
ncbi:MAG: hypothetical protein LCH32_12060 [Bacteroidetes bacterium]|uniref:hypothetical protein n=1 Tax=Flavobacterium filum TaxID=370974 RepID=UPI0023F28BFD|nr:hypothetical protein [Flavobacterium filum]MCA0431224.1 hypothetical protein [Bacteroidota bacterium]